MFDFIAFDSAIMLLGLLAAAIPFVLHLLSSIKAQEVYYPTLRFLKLSMEKTARRRRVQHWLLLTVRSLLLAGLAIAVAGPLVKSGASWTGSKSAAAVMILDNSYSMATADGRGVRLVQARTQARALLDDAAKRPTTAALLLTNGESPATALTGDMAALRKTIDATTVGYGRADIGAKILQAIDRLDGEKGVAEKSIYVFSDLQRESFDSLLKDAAGTADSPLQQANKKNIHVFLINAAQPRAVDVGVADLQVTGRPIADQPLQFNVSLVNSSDQNVRVNVDLRVDGQSGSQRQSLTLPPGGKESRQFRQIFTQPGTYTGNVMVSIANDSEAKTPLLDQLETDNQRQFAVQIGGRVKVLVVRGDAGEDGSGLDGAMYLKSALDVLRGTGKPWSIVPEVVEASRIKAEQLQDVSMAVFNEVESFTPEQAKAVTNFVGGGGTALFFLGPQTQVDNYNKRFFDDLKATGPLLPGKIGQACGEVGPSAMAEPVDRMDLSHPFLAGLLPNGGDYLVVMANRYYKLEDVVPPAKVIMTLRSGEPLVAMREYGRGLAVVCPTTASPRWANLCAGGSAVFNSMLYRMALSSPREARHDLMFPVRADVPIQTGPVKADSTGPAEIKLSVTTPQNKVELLTARMEERQGYQGVFANATQPGVYHWTIEGGEGLAVRQSGGAFAVNVDGAECDLAALGTDEFQRICENRQLANVFAGETLAQAQAHAVTASQGKPWWDKILMIVILLLVAEALIANRRKLTEDIVPAHLNPKIAN